MKVEILDFIPFGQKNALSMKELALRAGISTRSVRKAVYSARNSGAVICSACCDDKKTGYFRPNSADEVRSYVAMQRHRIESAKQAVRSAEKYLLEEKRRSFSG